jgi:hypothetical protein
MNFGWGWDQIMESPVAILMLMWRQIMMSNGKSVGFTLEELELLQVLSKKVRVIKHKAPRNKAIRQ